MTQVMGQALQSSNFNRHENKQGVIVGAGPAGLTSALLLAKRGWKVEVFEKRDHPKQEAVINAQRSVVFALLTEASKNLTTTSLNFEISGELFSFLQMKRGVLALEEAGFHMPNKSKGEIWKNNAGVGKGLTIVNRKNAQSRLANIADYFLVERDGFSEGLTEVISNLNHDRIKIHYKHRVDSIDFGERKMNFTSDSGKSSSIHYDLLLGADGRSSAVRKLLSNYDTSVKYETGLNGRSWKSFSNLPNLEDACVERMKLNDKDGVSFVAYSDGDSRIFIWPTIRGVIGGALQMRSELFTEESNNIEAYKRILKEVSPFFPEEWLEDAAKQLVGAPIGKIGTAWCNTSIGPNTVLLGDSANAVTPQLGQGVNSALESCQLLVKELDKHDDIQAACQSFNEKRHPDLHALTALDKQAPDRFGVNGKWKVRFISFILMQNMVWRLLHKWFPSIFRNPETRAMTETMRYREVVQGYKRDESIVRAMVTIGFSALGVFVFQGLQKVIA